MPSPVLDKISHLDSNHRLAIALVASILTFFWVPGHFFSATHLTLVWISFALTLLWLSWTTIFRTHPQDIAQLSGMADSSRILILLFTAVAALASLFTVIEVLDETAKQNPDHQRYILLSILSVATSWTLLHTVFTLRYAHLYYGDDVKQGVWPRGLDFPQEPEPDYLDFAYFSFVIGMTSQVSDVAVSSKDMRRLALMHGLISFLFNVVIIALTIGGLSGSI
jgi:uncharacterized membrane protein